MRWEGTEEERRGTARDKLGGELGTCWNCGGRGHFGGECKEPNFERAMTGGVGEAVKERTMKADERRGVNNLL